MQITNEEAQQRREKMEKSVGNMQFALSPQAFLMLKKGHTYQAMEFTLIWNGKYIQRNGLQHTGDFPIPESGVFLMNFNNGRFLSLRADGKFEFASPKKALSRDFSMALMMRFCERLVLIIADGGFSREPYLLILADTSENERFGMALMRSLVNAEDYEMLKILDLEDNEDGEEKEEE